jgi:hypothetical protein
MSFDLGSYNDVASRIAEFRDKHPEGSLQPADPAQPFTVQTIGEKTFLTYTAAAYRTPDDPRPGIGVAWEPFPGRTNYTRDSELQNVETSAWGRAIVAALAADTRKGIASREEVQNRQADRDSDWEAASPASAGQSKRMQEFLNRINDATDEEGIAAIGREVHLARSANDLNKFQYELLAKAASARMAELKKAEETT